jgi:hypothetical protein
MRIIAGLGAILFPVCNILPLRFVDIERENDSNRVAGLLFLFAYTLLLPLVYVLYKELSAVSRPGAAGVSILGVGVVLGVAAGVSGVLNFTTTTIVTSACLSLWVGLAGLLAFAGHVLKRAWAVFSVAIGALALVAAALTAFGGTGLGSSPALAVWIIYIPAVAIWAEWTGIMFLLRARKAPAGA